MSRTSTIAIVVLASLALAEGVMLWHRTADTAVRAVCTDDAPHAGGATDTVGPGPIDAPALRAVLGRLTSIDARLAALERSGTGSSAALSPPHAEAPDPAGFAEADRRLSTLIPGRVLDHDDVMRFQATVAALPADQRLALSAAFSRAVNEDRIRLRF